MITTLIDLPPPHLHVVRVAITADSGGRLRRTRYDIPRRRVQARKRGQHRPPRPSRWRHAW